jgi:phospholipid/cholesterol/gamma-HCH transport system permease protein
MSAGVVARQRFPRVTHLLGSTRSGWRQLGEQTRFYGKTIVALLDVFIHYRAELLRQIAAMSLGTGALAVIGGTVAVVAFLTMSTGGLVAAQGYNQFSQVGLEALVGFASAFLNTRLITPNTAAIALAATIGAGATAQLGAMRINEEIDAFEVEGVNPMAYVVGTRLAGAIIFVPIAVAAGLLGGDLGSLFQAVPVLHATSPGGFLHYHWSAQNLTDNLQALLNLGSMAIFIVIVSCFYGYRTRGGPAAVGESVSRSLLVNLVMVHVIATFWVFMFFGLNPNLPIGG